MRVKRTRKFWQLNLEKILFISAVLAWRVQWWLSYPPKKEWASVHRVSFLSGRKSVPFRASQGHLERYCHHTKVSRFYTERYDPVERSVNSGRSYDQPERSFGQLKRYHGPKERVLGSANTYNGKPERSWSQSHGHAERFCSRYGDLVATLDMREFVITQRDLLCQRDITVTRQKKHSEHLMLVPDVTG